VKEHASTENSEENVNLPADVGKGRRNEVSECEVECWKTVMLVDGIEEHGWKVNLPQFAEVARATAFPRTRRG
jgi:hypothetical protein